ncbi:MAG: hypothetical protein ACYS26_10850 [Planctomycetota bacterium]|jgi:hypothetical protein
MPAVPLGTPPRKLSWLARRRLRLIREPKWFAEDPNHGLGAFMAGERHLMQRGVVVPGAIVQANHLLWEPGEDAHPAELVYCLDPGVALERLPELAHELYELKGTKPDERTPRFIADHLANERTRTRGVRLPLQLAGQKETFTSTTIVYREHLPKGHLDGNRYPVLVCPSSHVALILPHDLWSAEGWGYHGCTSE